MRYIAFYCVPLLLSLFFVQTSFAVNKDTLYEFNTGNRSVTQPIDDMAEPGDYKFVQVEVIKVSNPQMLEAVFRVEYKLKHKKMLLGTFSLYPPNNPGRFIVTTHGKLKKGGSIILSVILPDGAEKNDFRARVKKMVLVNK